MPSSIFPNPLQKGENSLITGFAIRKLSLCKTAVTLWFILQVISLRFKIFFSLQIVPQAHFIVSVLSLPEIILCFSFTQPWVNTGMKGSVELAVQVRSFVNWLTYLHI